jgi:hypothetical protein
VEIAQADVLRLGAGSSLAQARARNRRRSKKRRAKEGFGAADSLAELEQFSAADGA